MMGCRVLSEVGFERGILDTPQVTTGLLYLCPLQPEWVCSGLLLRQ